MHALYVYLAPSTSFQSSINFPLLFLLCTMLCTIVKKIDRSRPTLPRLCRLPTLVSFRLLVCLCLPAGFTVFSLASTFHVCLAGSQYSARPLAILLELSVTLCLYWHFCCAAVEVVCCFASVWCCVCHFWTPATRVSRFQFGLAESQTKVQETKEGGRYF